MIEVENRFPCALNALLFCFNQRCPFLCPMPIDIVCDNTMQYGLFIGTKTVHCIQFHPQYTTPTRYRTWVTWCDTLVSLGARPTSAQVHSMIVWGLNRQRVLKNDVKQDVLCAINSKPKLVLYCSCYCAFFSLYPFFAIDSEVRSHL